MVLSVKSDTSKRLGALLLQGWAMLAESCPDCKVPLMRERTTHERLCVNCDTTFVSDNQGLRPTNRPMMDHAEEEPPLCEHQQDGSIKKSKSADDEVQCDYDPRADPRLGPFASSLPESGVEKTNAPAGASERVSQAKILPAAGAEHTGSQGGGTSASISGVTARAVTAAAGHGTGRAGTTDGAPAANGAANVAASVGQDREPSSAAADPIEDVADLIAAKMLQGWALLDKNCPRCNTVLVRSRANKRMFCVACDAWVVTEADTQRQPQPLASPPSPLPPPSARAGEEPATAKATQASAPVSTSPPALGPPLDATRPPLPTSAQDPLLQELQNQNKQPPQKQVLSSFQVAGPLPTALGAALPCVSAVLTHTRPSPGPVQPPVRPPVQQQQQLPLMYQQFFTPVVAAVEAGGGTASDPRDSSPPQQWPGLGPSCWSHGVPRDSAQLSQQQQQQQPDRDLLPTSGQGQGQAHSCGSNGIDAGGTSGGCGGGSQKPRNTTLLLAIGRTVALKMAEAQGLLERTPALDTERARSYVALLSESLDLLAKLNSLQQ